MSTSRFAILIAMLPLYYPCMSFGQDVTASLGWEHFIEGVSPVENQFEVRNAPPGTFSVSFYIDKYDGLPIQIDNKGSDGWVKSFDMGRVRPGSTLKVICLGLTGDTLGNVQTHAFEIIPKSSWLKESKIVVSTVVGRTVSMHASYPIGFLLDNRVPGDIVGMAGRRYSVFDPTIEMSIAYDIDTRRSVVTDPALNLALNLFDQRSAYRSIPLPSADIRLDSAFNLRVHAGDSIYLRLFQLDLPSLIIPVGAIIDIRFDVGLELNALLKGNVVVGNEGADWGFVRDGDQVTGISATIEGIGKLRGGIRVLAGLLSLRGQLSLVGRLGSGVEYVTVPSPSSEQLFGGSLAVYGELKAKAFWFITLFHIGPAHLWGTSFGRLPNSIVYTGDGALVKSTTSMVDEAFVVPEFAPQPVIDAGNDRVAIAWLEHQGGETQLLISTLDPVRNSFSSPSAVHSTRHPVATPRLSFNPDGKGLIVWTQNRYLEESAPRDARLIDMAAAQDIWLAAVDTAGNMVTAPFRIADDTTELAAGRAEGEPQILSFDDGSGLLVWMSLNDEKTGSELWYTVITRFGDQLELSPPKPVLELAGTNRSPTLVKHPEGKAELLWIHEGVNAEPMEVLRSTWDGSNWQAPVSLAAAESGGTFEELTAAGRNGTMLAAWTQTRYFENGRYDAGLSSALRDPVTGLWTVGEFTVWDSASIFSNPSVSLSQNQRAVISYQVVPKVVDSISPNNGRRYLGISDLADPSRSWKTIPGFEFLSDTTSFVWDGQTGFGANETLYLLTEEHGTSSEGSITFADPKLGLKLRTARLTSELDIMDIEEPKTPTTGVSESEDNEVLEISLRPNPATEEVILSYRIDRSERVRLELYNILGQKIEVLLDKHLEAGFYETQCTVHGLSTGTYFIRLSAGDQTTQQALHVGW